MKKLTLAYFGSPDFASDFLEKILQDKSLPFEVRLVVTQPDQPVGRKQILTPTPVRKVAEQYKNSEDTFFETIARGPLGGVAVEKNGIELKDIDLGLVYAYGDLIPKELLALPKYGFWNVHPSLLPKYRGPSPIATPLINGDKITGVTIIKMDEEIDHGPIIAQQSLTIEKDDKRPDLEKKLTDLGFEMFKNTVTQLTGSRVNGLKTKEQNHTEATYTNRLSKSDGFIDFPKLKNLLLPTTNNKLQTSFYNLFRGLFPWPGLWTILPNGRRLKLTQLKMENEKLIIEKVQLESKSEVDFSTFNKAYNIL